MRARHAVNVGNSMTWIADGWMICPECDQGLDMAAVFGEETEENYAFRDGLEGTCDMCLTPFTVRLVVKKPQPKWNGWDCTNCKAYHGYESIYVYGEDRLTRDALCSMCNYRFLAWIEACA